MPQQDLRYSLSAARQHIIQTWKLSADPQFIDKVRDVVGLSREAVPPMVYLLGHTGERPARRAEGLVGHAGAILLRKAADQAGLTGRLSAALLRKGTSPLLDRGGVLVSP